MCDRSPKSPLPPLMPKIVSANAQTLSLVELLRRMPLHVLTSSCKLRPIHSKYGVQLLYSSMPPGVIQHLVLLSCTITQCLSHYYYIPTATFIPSFHMDVVPALIRDSLDAHHSICLIHDWMMVGVLLRHPDLSCASYHSDTYFLTLVESWTCITLQILTRLSLVGDLQQCCLSDSIHLFTLGTLIFYIRRPHLEKVWRSSKSQLWMSAVSC